ncbi:MAG TPA: glycosyltransferase family 39 protein [Victivallales bacterium]|nr:glycosyltransferase family 39 protein [Victivallales bacterium]
MSRFINRNFVVIIYCLYAFVLFTILFQLRCYHLLPMPEEGTDQRSILSAAAALSRGIMWNDKYLYSPAYTCFLAFLVFLSRGEIIIIRIMQALLCALIPVFIYKSSRNLRLPFVYSQLSAIIYFFYAASALISLDFLRAGPLSLLFILYYYFLIRGYRTLKRSYFIFSGIFAGLLVLGRENFIPVVCIPLLFLFLRDVRKRVEFRNIFYMIFFALFPVLFVCILNYYRFSKFAILPGNAKNVISFYYPGYEVKISNVDLWKVIFSKFLGNVRKYLSSYEIPNSLSIYAHSDFSEMLKVLFIPFNAIAVTSFFTLLLDKQKASFLLFLFILSYFFSMVIFEPFYRFRIPVVPLLCVGAGIVIYRLSRCFFYKKIIYILVITLFIVLTYENPQPKRTYSERRATILILIKEGRLFRAEKRISELKSEGYNVSDLERIYQKYLNGDGAE